MIPSDPVDDGHLDRSRAGAWMWKWEEEGCHSELLQNGAARVVVEVYEETGASLAGTVGVVEVCQRIWELG